MITTRWALVLGLALVGSASATGVDGSEVTYPAKTNCQVGDAVTAMRITGTGLREKMFVNVYAIASYIAADAERPGGADGLARADVAKMLHLKMEREVAGAKMGSAFADAVKSNYSGQFGSEVARLKGFLSASPAAKGESIKFISMPGVGLKCTRGGGKSVQIDNPAFAVAVWHIYLGRRNVDGDIKKGLVKRL